MLGLHGSRLARLLAPPRLAALGVLIIGLIGTVIYARVVNDVYAIRFWLFWKLAMVWGWIALFNLACASFGQFVLVRGLRMRDLPALESAVLSMSTGVVAFTLAMYVGGALGWYRPVFAIALPLAMLAVGAPDTIRLGGRLAAELRAETKPRLLITLIGAAGVLCVGVIYLGAFTPYSLNYDAAWSHLVVAQEYARAGKIVAFPADYNRNVPQLASLIYTWNYLVPGLNAPLRWMLALHSEFSLFLWTLAGVAALIRALVGDSGLRSAWVSFFLFPIIFVYDNNLGGAADHICGFFAVPIALASLRMCESFSREAAALVAISSAGGLLTKYQAVFLIAPAAIVIAAHWLWYLAEHRPARLRRGRRPQVPMRELRWSPVVLAGLGMLLISPHFLRQFIFYHNPFYPFLQDVVASTPTVPNAAYLMANALADPNYQPTGTLADKLWHGAKLFLTFSFKPHYSFSRDVPSFGSLFTLLFPTLLFLPDRRRTSVVGAIAAGAVLAWAMVYHIDRNLQVFMPVLVAVTGALIVKAWGLGWLARAGLVPLLALQIVWGGDALFYSQWDRIQNSMNLIRSGYEGKARRRFREYRKEFLTINKLLPKDARVLLHSGHLSLGIEREVWIDGAGFQGLIHYESLHSARELFDYLRSLGITHLLIDRDSDSPSKQEEVLWRALVDGYAIDMGEHAGIRVYAMPTEPPPEMPAYRVATLGLHGYRDGFYPIDRMTTFQHLPDKLQHFPPPNEPMPEDDGQRAAVLESADAVFVATRAQLVGRSARVLRHHFRRVHSPNDQLALYLAKRHFERARLR